MTPERWEQIERLYYSALEREADERESFLDQACAKDHTYALAWSGLSDSYMLLTVQNALSKDEAHPAAMEAARKAVKYAPDLAEARTSLAHALLHTNDLTGSEQEFRRAIQIKPNYALAHHWFGEYLGYVNRPDEALAELRRALELDPLDLAINAELGWHYMLARQFDLAIDQYRKTLNINPNYFLAHLWLGQSLLISRKYVEAANEFKRGVDLTKGNRGLGGLGTAYALLGKREDALQIVADLQEQANGKRVNPMDLASIYAALGDEGRAFSELEKALKESPPTLSAVPDNPAFDGLRTDARYIDLMRRSGLAR